MLMKMEKKKKIHLWKILKICTLGFNCAFFNNNNNNIFVMYNKGPC